VNAAFCSHQHTDEFELHGKVHLSEGSVALRLAILRREFVDADAPGQPDDIHCVLMDWNLGDDSVATLVAFEDGTTSLYLSTGGGIIGAGDHANVREVAPAFRAAATGSREHFRSTQDFTPPPNKSSRFFLVTRTGTLATPIIANTDLQGDAHPLAPLATRAQVLIAEIRRSSEVSPRVR